MAAAIKKIKPFKQSPLPGDLEAWTHVNVVWEDVKATAGGHVAAEFLKAVHQCIRRTAGYVLYYGDDYLIIAATDDRKAETDYDCEDITVIPLAYIRKITSHAR